MVSTKNILTIAVLLGGVAAYFGLGGARGIGSKVGGAFKDFGDSLVSPFFGGGKSIVDGITSTSAEQIVNSTNLGGNVTNIPSNQQQTLSTPRDKDITKGSLTIAGLINSLGLTDKVDLQNAVINRPGQFSQPFGFAIEKGGLVKTGSVGLNPATLEAQRKLSEKFGIATFDQAGNLSAFGGFVSAR